MSLSHSSVPAFLGFTLAASLGVLACSSATGTSNQVVDDGANSGAAAESGDRSATADSCNVVADLTADGIARPIDGVWGEPADTSPGCASRSCGVDAQGRAVRGYLSIHGGAFENYTRVFGDANDANAARACSEARFDTGGQVELGEKGALKACQALTDGAQQYLMVTQLVSGEPFGMYTFLRVGAAAGDCAVLEQSGTSNNPFRTLPGEWSSRTRPGR